jgi:hypothetical protein
MPAVTSEARNAFTHLERTIPLISFSAPAPPARKDSPTGKRLAAVIDRSQGSAEFVCDGFAGYDGLMGETPV